MERGTCANQQLFYLATQQRREREEGEGAMTIFNEQGEKKTIEECKRTSEGGTDGGN